jgi:predicted HAD superfamily Cof-like phosphohydrolase
VNDWQQFYKNDKELMQKYIAFRMAMIQEEVDETNAAIITGNPEEIVDGLIDMCVFAIGTLNVFGMDSQKAWDAVHNANMAKEPGVKESRPNPFGMPDLIKPDGWEGPSHEGNHGDLPNFI